MWGQILGAGMGLAQSLFAGKKKTEISGPSYTSSGWKGDTGGMLSGSSIIQEGPVDRNVTVEPKQPKSKWDWANEITGSTIGKIGTDVAGGFLSDKRSQRNSKKQFDRLRGEGLTAQEIAGGGGSGGAVAAQGNTLGNGPQRQARSQQAFQAEQAQLDRNARQKIVETQVGPARRQASVSEQRSGREAELQPHQVDSIKAGVQKIRTEVKRAKFDLKNIWAMKFASMSLENGMFALAAFNQGIDFRAVLQAGGNQTVAERNDANELYNIMLKSKGPSGGWLGIIELMRGWGKGDTLGTPYFEKTIQPGRGKMPLGNKKRQPLRMESTYEK